MGATRKVSAWGLLLAVGFCCSCESTGSGGAGGVAEKVLYNRYNIHYSTEKVPFVASYINLTDCRGHAVLPYNSPCTVTLGSSYFTLKAKDAGVTMRFEVSRSRTKMTVAQYVDLIMSPEPVSYSNLTPQDEQGIKAGQAMVGMTKQGVTIALGYPAKHKTPSTDLNTWYYWRNRYAYYWVNFDESGKVASTQN